jgi:DNA-directed RNA polymerase subunit alpha
VRPADDVPEETDWLIEELNIGVRPYNVLKHAGITTIGQLIDRTEREIRWLPGMGKTSMTDLKREMSERNLQFKAKR